MNLKILQWNCRSIRNKFDFSVLANDFDIILLVETWLCEEDLFRLKGFSVVRFDRLDRGGGGLAICIRNGVSYTETTLNFSNKTLETGSIVINSEMGDILITVCYRCPDNNNNITTLEWNHFQKAVTSHDASHFFVGGDFNAHHSLWGSRRNCSNGNVIVDNLDFENIILLNDHSPTYMKTSASEISFSNIDLSFSSTAIAMLSNWYVSDDKRGSDHFPIVLEVNTRLTPSIKPDYRYNLKKMDWTKFTELLNKKKPFFNSDEFLGLDPIARYDSFINFINESILQSLPRAKANLSASSNNIKVKANRGNVKSNCVWWNKDCDKVVRQRKAALLSIRHKFTMERFIEVNRTEALTRKTLKEEKKKSWMQFCESVSPNTKITDFWRKIKMFKNAANRNQESGNLKAQEESIMRTIEDLCAPKSDIRRSLKDVVDIEDDTSYRNFLSDPFSFEELDFILDSLKVKSAPGADKISYAILSALPEFYRRILLDIYNDFYHFKLFPKQWNQYLVIFIPKGNSNKMRPISLASCLLKVMEKLIKERLLWWLEHNDMLAKTQFGFRRGKSCVDNLSILTSEIQKGFFKKRPLSALFLDIKGAYDNVIPEILIDDLIELGLPACIIYFIKNLICERKVTFCTNFSLICKSIVKGLPQGSILSPLLYSIYTRKLENLLDNGTKILQFADDIVIYSEVGNNSQEQIMYLESTLDVILPFLADRGLAIAPEKCVLMSFDNSFRRLDKNLKILVNNNEVKASEFVKFLGMYLDRRLNWQTHINNIVNKCKSSMRILSCLRTTWWGADPRSLRQLYIALIRSRIEYGGFLISPYSPSVFHKLNKVQNLAIRIALGYRNSSPINVMLGESKIPSLDLRLKELGLKYVLKCLAVDNSPIIANLEIISNLAENFTYELNFEKPLLVKCYEDTWFLKDSIISFDKPYCYNGDYSLSLYKPVIDFKSGRKIRKSKDPNRLFNKIFPSNANSPIHIFTDGSKIIANNNNQVGFAAWSENGNLSFEYKIIDSASIYTAECFALLYTVDRICDNNVKDAVVFSDSESALKALSSYNFNRNNSLTFEIRQKLAYADSLGFKIKIAWVPAHVGIQGNEIVDAKAKLAAKEGKLLNVPIPTSDLFEKIKRDCKKENTIRLRNIAEEKGSFYFQNFFQEGPPWFFGFNLSRKAIVSINRLRCNHSSLNSSLYRQRITQSDLCACGKDSDTIDHILWCCELYDQERSELLVKIRKEIKYGPYSAVSLLSMFNKNIVHCLADFITNIKCKI